MEFYKFWAARAAHVATWMNRRNRFVYCSMEFYENNFACSSATDLLGIPKKTLIVSSLVVYCNFPFDQNGTSNLRRNCFASLPRNARDLNVSKRLLDNFWKTFVHLKILFKYNLLFKQTSFPVYKLIHDFINISFHENKLKFRFSRIHKNSMANCVRTLCEPAL